MIPLSAYLINLPIGHFVRSSVIFLVLLLEVLFLRRRQPSALRNLHWTPRRAFVTGAFATTGILPLLVSDFLYYGFEHEWAPAVMAVVAFLLVERIGPVYSRLLTRPLTENGR